MTQTAHQGIDVMHTHGVNERLGRPNRPRRYVARLVDRASSLPRLGTWLGVVLVGLGAVLLVLTWGRTAALTRVALQIPYVVSAGFTGLGLIAVGLTVVNLAAKRADARDRAQQSAELRALLAELRSVVEGDGR